MNLYRVWMKDGYCRLVRAESEDAARKFAIEKTVEDVREVAMSAREKHIACMVDFVDLVESRPT